MRDDLGELVGLQETCEVRGRRVRRLDATRCRKAAKNLLVTSSAS
jgi:hypothetical protein